MFTEAFEPNPAERGAVHEQAAKRIAKVRFT